MQKYVHDLGTWDALPVEQQEAAVGRTKLGDIELADDVRPADSHVALNTIVDEHGEEQQIMRFNMPFGRVGAAEFGTYFSGGLFFVPDAGFLDDPPGREGMAAEEEAAPANGARASSLGIGPLRGPG